MGSIVLKSLSILLGVFFIFVGITKLTPFISKELHKDLGIIYSAILNYRKEYVRYAKVFPFTEMLDFKIPSKWYRRVVGGLEIFFGLALALIPSHKIKNAANIGLVLLMILAAYSHLMVGDPFDRCAPALVFFFMLSGRLVVCTVLKTPIGVLLLPIEVRKTPIGVLNENRPAPGYQTSRREELEKAAATQNGNGLKRD